MMLVFAQTTGETSGGAGGLVTVPFEFVAVAVGLLVTAGLVYMVRKHLEDDR